MKNLIQSKIFIIVFLVSYFLFFALTINRLHSSLGTNTAYGFPFAYYYSHCFGENYNWLGFAGNLLCALILSSVTGLASSHLRLKVSSPEFRAKWYL